jgi:tRNA (guanine26-N2/guanine27-N2)-dimethyltransferase
MVPLNLIKLRARFGNRVKRFLAPSSAMGFWFSVEEEEEGAARLLVPTIERGEDEHLDHARSRAAVFYNPLMRLNRDTAVLAVSVKGDHLGRPVEACEPMCGCGVRGVRLALEAGAGSVLMGDLNPSGVKISEENTRRNGVSDRVRVRFMDANLMLNLHSSPMNRLDYVDIDPFGSPSGFLDSVVRAIRDGGVIALTATDMAPLCGVSPPACLRKYGGKPLRTAYTHEVALRLVIGAAVRAAAIHEMGINPLFGYYADHYVRVYLNLRHSAKQANAALAEMGYIVHCPRCLHREAVKGAYLKASRTCLVCSGKLIVGGPMWLGDLADDSFTSDMLEKAVKIGGWEPRLIQLIEVTRGEIGFPPTYFHLDEFSSRAGKSSLNRDEVIAKLTAAGFRVTRTHFDPRGIKTTASAIDLGNVIKG